MVRLILEVPEHFTEDAQRGDNHNLKSQYIFMLKFQAMFSLVSSDQMWKEKHIRALLEAHMSGHTHSVLLAYEKVKSFCKLWPSTLGENIVNICKV